MFFSSSFICITKSGLPAVCISGNCSFLVLFSGFRVVGNKVNSWQVYVLIQSGSGLTSDLFSFFFSFGPEDNNASSVEMYNIRQSC